mgnify:CR=1 FL=1
MDHGLVHILQCDWRCDRWGTRPFSEMGLMATRLYDKGHGMGSAELAGWFQTMGLEAAAIHTEEDCMDGAIFTQLLAGCGAYREMDDDLEQLAYAMTAFDRHCETLGPAEEQVRSPSIFFPLIFSHARALSPFLSCFARPFTEPRATPSRRMKRRPRPRSR